MSYFQHIGILICIYIVLTTSLNLIVGFTGLLNIGHAAFFGIGAYTSALLTLLGVPWIFALIAGFIMAGIFGFLIAVPCLRLRGDYLAIATLGFGEIIRAIMKNWVGLTRGPLGIPGIPKAELFGYAFNTPAKFLILSIIIAAIVVFIIYRITHSPFGRVLRSIREDEIAAQAMGKDIVRYKVTATVLGAAFAGIAGSMYAHYITFIDPTTFTLSETILILCMVVLGGMGSIKGSVIGAIILIILPEPIRFLGLPTSAAAALRQMIYAVILIALMLKRPEGIFGEKRHKTKVKAKMVEAQNA
jgi:branched-chain amino acid transport system permease protein